MFINQVNYPIQKCGIIILKVQVKKLEKVSYDSGPTLRPWPFKCKVDPWSIPPLIQTLNIEQSKVKCFVYAYYIRINLLSDFKPES